MAKKNSLMQLKAGEIPERYRRNIGTIGITGQIKLLESKVLVVGAGGLGGTVIELLARQGVGYIRIADADRFSAHNLNRQLLCTEKNLGELKVEQAVKRVSEINSDVNVQAVAAMLSEKSAIELLAETDLVVDGLDNVSDRLLLSRLAQQLGIPLVHGAIDGFSGQVMVVLPHTKGLEYIYQSNQTKRELNSSKGNPAATPAVVAAIQTQEAIKILTGRGDLLTNQLLFIDLETNSFEIIKLN